VDAATRETIRRARDAQQRERMARGGLVPVDPGTCARWADEADEAGQPWVAERFRRLGRVIERMYAAGATPERADDIVYRWLYRLCD
jgi:glutathione S-transferase